MHLTLALGGMGRWLSAGCPRGLFGLPQGSGFMCGGWDGTSVNNKPRYKNSRALDRSHHDDCVKKIG